MARKTIYESSVRGAGAFPVDMLRYDRATPTTERDSVEISHSLDRMHPRDTARTVTVTSERPLTAGRWESFGWAVVDTKSWKV